MSRPLAGRRVLVTRRPDQSAVLASGLAALGADVIEVPTLELAPPDDPAPMARALDELDRYDWIAFTSANAVHALGEALSRRGRALPGAGRLAVVGPSTAEVVHERLGRRSDLQPSADFRAEGLLLAFEGHDLGGRRVLLPVSDKARATLAEGLRERGARVDVVVAYRTVTPADTGARLERALAQGIALVTLASPSAVDGLAGALGPRVRGLPAAVIGPVTEQAARAAGLDVQVVATPSTVQGLLEAVARHFARAPLTPEP